MLRDRRDWPGALTAFEANAKVLVEVTENEQSPVVWRKELGQALLELGRVQVEQKEFTKAVGSFQQGRTVISNLWRKVPEMAALLNDLLELYDAEAEAWQAQGKTQEADALAREADGILKKEISDRPDNPNVWVVAWSHHLREGDNAKNRNQVKAADEAYRKGLESIRKAVELDRHRWVLNSCESYTHKSIGDLRSNAKDRFGAKQAYDAALAAAEKGFSPSPNATLQHQIYIVHVAAGDMFRDQAERDKALDEYTQAKSAIEEAMRMAQTNRLYVSNLRNLQQRIGGVKQEAKDIAGAEEAYRAAVAAGQEAAKLAPDNAEYANELHLALCDLGGILHENGNYTEALEQYTLAQSALEKAKNAGLDERDYLERVGRLHRSTAEVKDQARDLPGAEKAYRAAVDAAESAFKLATDNAVCANLLGLARVDLAKILLRQPDKQAAFVQFDGAVDASERAASLDSKKPLYHKNLARIYLAVADAREASKDVDKAKRAYRNAAKAAGQALDLAPGDTEIANDMFLAQQGLGGILQQKGNSQAALREYLRAVEAINTATRLSKNTAEYFRNSAAVHRQVAVLRKHAGDRSGSEEADRTADSADEQAAKLDAR
jgi:tetratricopeptide (TPR) repeat protein